jgi:hypothetical protein
MAKNKFGIPDDLLRPIRERDKNCAYCGKKMVFPYRRERIMESATIEHLNNNGPFHWKDGLELKDIVYCCAPCNSSRGQKLLPDWFLSPYCIKRGISTESVAEAVRCYLGSSTAVTEAVTDRR